MPKKKPMYVTLKQQVIWIVSTAFAIAAALFWKDTITQIINAYIPANQSLTYSVYASTIVTVIAIITVWIMHKILKE